MLLLGRMADTCDVTHIFGGLSLPYSYLNATLQDKVLMMKLYRFPSSESTLERQWPEAFKEGFNDTINNFNLEWTLQFACINDFTLPQLYFWIFLKYDIRCYLKKFYIFFLVLKLLINVIFICQFSIYIVYWGFCQTKLMPSAFLCVSYITDPRFY